jgi:hypothetical protein
MVVKLTDNIKFIKEPQILLSGQYLTAVVAVLTALMAEMTAVMA